MRLLAVRPLCMHHIPTWPTPDLGFYRRRFPKQGIWCQSVLGAHHIPTWPTPDLGFYRRRFPKSRNVVSYLGVPVPNNATDNL